jgi:hypothetical protein
MRALSTPDEAIPWRREVSEAAVPSPEVDMITPGLSATPTNGRRDLSAKLRAALDYLGDRLATHRASRYKPAKRYVLDEWMSAREATRRSPSRRTPPTDIDGDAFEAPRIRDAAPSTQ